MSIEASRRRRSAELSRLKSLQSSPLPPATTGSGGGGDDDDSDDDELLAELEAACEVVVDVSATRINNTATCCHGGGCSRSRSVSGKCERRA